MKKKLLAGAALITGMILLAASVSVADKPAAQSTNTTPEEIEAKYSQAIEGRTADILKELNITNPAASARVHDAIIAQYRALRAWHDANDANLKQAAKSDTNMVAQIQASLKTLHEKFISNLATDLTPEQVGQVKDKMTYGVREVTYNAYLKMYPDLNDEEKKQIMVWLIEAREIAMDGGLSEEKHAVFGKYKGRINNYLAKAGYDSKTGRKKSDPQPVPLNANTNQPSK
jgi:hypothetical protein